MRSFWKIAVSVACVALIRGAASGGQLDNGNADGRKVTGEASVARGDAEHLDAKAQYKLGAMYYHGQGEQQDYGEALRWFHKAADQGDAKAKYAIGYMYYHGQGVPQDYSEALRWYRDAADQGDSQAQSELGYMYYQGKGVPQDYAEATHWYRSAAEQGEAMAQDGLGFAYYQGKGVPQDYAEAFHWYRKAADQGYVRAQYDLGRMYFDGNGVAQDYTEAAVWFHKAADQGDARAQYALGLTTHPGTFGELYLSLAALASVLLLIDSLLPGPRIRDRQRGATALTGLLGLAWVGLNLYGFSYIGTLQPGPLVDSFHFAKNFFAGTFGAMLIFLILPQSAKIVLKTTGTLFVGFNIYGIAHYDLRRLAPAVKLFCSVNGWLIGMSISSAIFLWLTRKSIGKTNQASAEL